MTTIGDRPLQRTVRELIEVHLRASGPCVFSSIASYVHAQGAYGTTDAVISRELQAMIRSGDVGLYETGDAYEWAGGAQADAIPPYTGLAKFIGVSTTQPTMVAKIGDPDYGIAEHCWSNNQPLPSLGETVIDACGVQARVIGFFVADGGWVGLWCERITPPPHKDAPTQFVLFGADLPQAE